MREYSSAHISRFLRSDREMGRFALRHRHRRPTIELNEHPAYINFLVEGSLGGMDPILMWRVDCRGFSDASQATRRALEVKDRAWTFEAVIDVAHHPDLIMNCSGDISSDYFEVNSSC
jgi:hypothetical protein